MATETQVLMQPMLDVAAAAGVGVLVGATLGAIVGQIVKMFRRVARERDARWRNDVRPSYESGPYSKDL